jgi:hypothetical protein
MGISKFPKIELLWFYKAITLCADLWSGWGLKQSCNPRQELFNDMSHTTCTQGSRSDSRLLMVGSQTANLIPDPSFGHNLCFKCPNGSCELTLDIYVPRTFQWYSELLNPMVFDSFNHSLKIWKSTETPTPNMGAHLGCECSFSHTLVHSQPPRSMKCDSRASLLTCTLTSLCLSRKPKARVVIKYFHY